MSLIKRQHKNQYHVIHCRVSTFLFPLSASLQNEAGFAISESHIVRSCESHELHGLSSVMGASQKQTTLRDLVLKCFCLCHLFLLNNVIFHDNVSYDS